MVFNKKDFIDTLDDMFGFNLWNNKDWIEYDFWQYKLNRIYKPLIKYFVKEFSKSIETSSFSENEKQRILDIFVDFFSLYYKNWDFGYFKSKFNNYQYRVNYSWNDTEFFWATKDCYYVKTTDVINEIDINIWWLLNEWENMKIKFFKKTKPEITDWGKEKFTFSIEVNDIYQENDDLEWIQEDLEKIVIWKEFVFYNFEQDSTGKSTKIKNIKEFMKAQNIDLDNNSSLKNTLDNFLKKWGRDYFIHKRLWEFLREELEWFFFQVLKNDIQWQINILTIKQKIEEIKEKYAWDEEVIQFKIWKLIDENQSSVNRTIYEFVYAWIYNFINILSDLEELKKSLWLKKRKITKQEYCITLEKFINAIDLLPLRPQILNEILNNEKQIKEWEELLEKWFKHLKDIDINIVKEELNSGELIKSKNFVIDTINFEKDSKVYKKLEELWEKELYENNLLDWILIKSENFQALNTFQERYNWKIDLCYIDPPFNTWSDFAYKDDYQDSNWNTMILERINLTKNLLSEKWSFYLHLDYNADFYWKIIMNKIFWTNNRINDIIWNYRWTTNSKKIFAPKHDIIFSYWKNSNYIFNFDDVRIPYDDENKFQKDEEWKWFMWRDKNKKYYPVQKFINWNWLVLWKSQYDVWSDIVSMATAHWLEYLWFNTQKPEKLLKRIMLASSNTESIILDYFSWSWTTIATWQKIKRKWIWIELWNHYETIDIPRMKRVLEWEEWWISKDVDWNWTKWNWWWFFKYLYLNQYQDWFDDNWYMKNVEQNVKKIENMNIDDESNKIEDILFAIKSLKKTIYELDEKDGLE